MTNAEYGYWRVVGRPVQQGYRWYQQCLCICGATRLVREDHLRSGESRSCGCMKGALLSDALTVHGHDRRDARTTTYDAWRSMMRRCYAPHANGYGSCGGKGIHVCRRWAESFPAFLADIGTRPSTRHVLDRRDPDGDYEPSNCRWATWAEMKCNRKCSSTTTKRWTTARKRAT